MDWNGDGKPDLLAIDDLVRSQSEVGSRWTLLLGDGRGYFEQANSIRAQPEYSAVALADIDGDGQNDIVVTDSRHHSVTVLRSMTPTHPENKLRRSHVINVGIRTDLMLSYAEYSVGLSPVAVVLADINHDGLLDIITANRGGEDLSVLMGKSAGVFAAATSIPTGANPRALIVEDLTGDGHLDIVVAQESERSLRLLVGDGRGGFRLASTLPLQGRPRALIRADLDQDHKLDLAVLSETRGELEVLYGQGDAQFSRAVQYSVGALPVAFAVGDADSLGRRELAVAFALHDEIRFYAFDSQRHFTETHRHNMGRHEPVVSHDGRIHWVIDHEPSAVAIVDVDGDHRTELVVGSRNRLTVWKREPGGGLGSTPVRVEPGVVTALTVGRLDSDQSPDVLFVGGRSIAAALLLNIQNTKDLFLKDTRFEPRAFGAQPHELLAGDFDQDGWTDLLSTSIDSSMVSLYLGLPGGRFSVPLRFSLGDVPAALIATTVGKSSQLSLVLATNGSSDVEQRTFDATLQPSALRPQAALRVLRARTPGCFVLGDSFDSIEPPQTLMEMQRSILHSLAKTERCQSGGGTVPESWIPRCRFMSGESLPDLSPQTSIEMGVLI